MAKPRSFWLMKSEPDEYSIDDLERDGRGEWDGVRNYQARNFMRDQMHVGDLVLFYHSNTSPPGVVGVARVCRESYPDPTQFEPGHKHEDPKSKPESPRWVMVDVEFVEKFPRTLTLEELKAAGELEGMPVRQRGQRLSVQPVEKEHFRWVLRAVGAKTKIR